MIKLVNTQSVFLYIFVFAANINAIVFFNRPGVAGAVLHTPPSLID